MSAAVQQGRIAPEYAVDRWDPPEPEPQTPLSVQAQAQIARARAATARALEARFGPRSDVAMMLGLTEPAVILDGIATVREMAVELVDLDRRIDVLRRTA